MPHNNDHSHGHNHNHDHSHTIGNYNRAFGIGIALNVIFVIIEVVYGLSANSLALLADAGHNLSDVLSLLLAWGAGFLALKKPTQQHTYGFRRVTIMASAISAVLLLAALGGIVVEAVGKLSHPQPSSGIIIIVVAAIGVVINGITALMFMSGQKHDLNIKGAYLHMATDAAVSLGVVVAGFMIMFTGWLWLDPVISLAIVAIVMIGTWSLLRDSLNLSIDGAPKTIDVTQVKELLTGFKQVKQIHDLHIWALSTTEIALTVHLITAQDKIDNELLKQIEHSLHEKFNINHITIQVEQANSDYNCKLDRSECI